MPKLVVFDLDKTLARSKEAIEPRMANLLVTLLERTKVAIISGGALSQFLIQVINQLPSSAHFESLSLLPTSGAALYEWSNGKWNRVYEEHITEDEEKQIESVIRSSSTETGLIDFATHSYGERIEYRGSQVTLSALGQEAPIHEKELWDPTGEKKKKLRDAIGARLSEFDVKVGGSTSIDITKQGVNKAYGVRKLSEHLTIPIAQMLYIGDALFPGGNDEVVKESGITTHTVKDPEETAAFIESLLK
jgi:phosphomannomutase